MSYQSQFAEKRIKAQSTGRLTANQTFSVLADFNYFKQVRLKIGTSVGHSAIIAIKHLHLSQQYSYKKFRKTPGEESVMLWACWSSKGPGNLVRVHDIINSLEKQEIFK
ncbi:hypothetical protein AMECASPLE_037448 [Ameca splendens]|uniref:Uncharacterized protein n=1 Tax=Ameca splendens TaxID=208324 RepID=A0ABV0Y8K4_9TELE